MFVAHHRSSKLLIITKTTSVCTPKAGGVLWYICHRIWPYFAIYTKHVWEYFDSHEGKKMPLLGWWLSPGCSLHGWCSAKPHISWPNCGHNLRHCFRRDNVAVLKAQWDTITDLYSAVYVIFLWSPDSPHHLSLRRCNYQSINFNLPAHCPQPLFPYK